MKVTGLRKSGGNRYTGPEWTVFLETDSGEPAGAIAVDETILMDFGNFNRACKASFLRTVNEPSTQAEWLDLLKRLFLESEAEVASR